MAFMPFFYCSVFMLLGSGAFFADELADWISAAFYVSGCLGASTFFTGAGASAAIFCLCDTGGTDSAVVPVPPPLVVSC